MRILCVLLILFLSIAACKQPTTSTSGNVSNSTDSANWKNTIDSILPGYGHRNWILVVDKAFPALASSSGMKVININTTILPVLRYLNTAIQKSPHVFAHLYMDKELNFIPSEKESILHQFKDSLHDIFRQQAVAPILHDSVFTKVAATSKEFQVLVLKTNTRLAYCSIYFQLDCKYWNADKEKALRNAMAKDQAPL